MRGRQCMYVTFLTLTSCIFGSVKAFYLHMQAQPAVSIPGMEVDVGITVEPRQNTVCIIYMDVDNCSHILLPEHINVQYNETRYGTSIGYILNHNGVFFFECECENDGNVKTASAEISVQTILTGLSSDNGPLLYRDSMKGQLTDERLSFTFTDGTHLQGSYLINGQAQNISTVVINENDKTGYLLLEDTLSSNNNNRSQFEIEVTVVVSNGHGSEDFTTKFVVKENIEGLTLITDTLVLVNTTHDLNAYVQWGTDLSHIWRVDNELIKDNDGSSLQYFFDRVGLTSFSVTASNELGSESDTVTVQVVYPVRGFKASFQENSDILITFPDVDYHPMGNLSSRFTWNELDYQTNPLSGAPNKQIKIANTLPQSGRMLKIVIFSDVSEQSLLLESNGRSLDMDIELSHTAVSVGSQLEILIINSTGPPFEYELDFGDGETLNKTEKNEITEDIRVNHLYKTMGYFTITFTAKTQGKTHTSKKDIAVQNSLNDFVFVAPSTILLPPGIATFQIEDVGMDIEPSNVTCELDLSDGPPVDLPWIRRQIYVHTYIQAARYIARTTCENLVSRVTKSKIIMVLDFSYRNFTIEYSRLIPMNSTQGKVQSVFAISLFNETKPPPNVTFSWDFGDGTVQSDTLKTWTKTHHYTYRDDYIVTVNVSTGHDGGTLGEFPLKIGMFSLKLTHTTVAINSSCSILIECGFTGKTVYLVEFGNGRTFQETFAEVYVGFVFSVVLSYDETGVYLPKVTVWNGGLVEEQTSNTNITVLWPVQKVYTAFNKTSIQYSSTNALFIDLKDVERFQDIKCEVDFGDGTELVTVHMDFNFKGWIEHSFLAVGNLSVSINCSNEVSYKRNVEYVHVFNECFGNHHPFGTLESPVRKLVCQRLTLTADISLYCTNKTPEFLWVVEEIKEDMTRKIEIKQPNTTVLNFPARSMKPGLYKVTIFANFRDMPSSFSTGSTLVHYGECSIRARIKGGTSKTVSSSKAVIVDALTYSYDPDDGKSFELTELEFYWKYGVLESQEEADRILNGSEITHCSSCLRTELNTRGILVFTPGCLEAERWHVLTVNVSKPTKFGIYTQIIHVKDDHSPQYDIRCKINCFDKVNAEFSFGLESECLDCSSEELKEAKHEWNLYEQFGDNLRMISDFGDMTSTGTDISTMSILPDTLLPGTKYSLQLEISGFTYRDTATVTLTFVVNFPPYNGTCWIEPNVGVAVLDRFSVLCEGWKDEGVRLNRSTEDSSRYIHYEFLVTNNGTPTLLYSGESPTTPGIQLPPGDEQEDFTLTITTKVFDQDNGMAVLNLSAKVKSPLDKYSAITNQTEVESVITAMETQLDQITLTGDIKQVARSTGSATSVLNQLVLPNENSSLPDDPDEWLTVQPSDLPDGNASATPWNTFWGDMLNPTHVTIKEDIEKVNAKNSKALSQTLDKADVTSSDVVHFVSGSVKTIMNVPDRVSHEALEFSERSLSKLGNSLKNVMSDEMSDIHEGAVLNSLVTALTGTMDAALPKESSTPKVSNLRDALRIIERNRGYDRRTSKKQFDEADLQDEERAFLYMRKVRQQEYYNNRRKQVSIKVTETVDKAVDQTLEAASTFLVLGQRPTSFGIGKGSAIIERNIIKRLFNRTYKSDEVSVKIPPSEVALGVDTDTQMKLKMSFIHKKPDILFNNTSFQEITSPAVKVWFERDDFWGNETDLATNVTLKQEIKIVNPVEVFYSHTVPRFIHLDRDQLLYHKVELASTKLAVTVYIKPSKDKMKYRVYFKAGNFPTARDFDYKTESERFLKENDTLRVICPENTLPQAGTVFLGLKPIPMELKPFKATKELEHKLDVYQPMPETESNFTEMTKTSFDIGIATTGCLSWEERTGITDVLYCGLSDESDLRETKCVCDQPLMSVINVAQSFMAPINAIDFSTVFTKIDLQNNSSVFFCVISLLVLYAFIALWARRKDQQDVLRWGVTSLADNFTADKYLYIVTVYTGLRVGAGTKSNIGFVVVGDDSDTGIRRLYDGIRKTVESRSVMHFVMGVPSSLGDLQYMRIWHDNSGKGGYASWFLHKVIVEDIQLDRRYTFHCDRWLAVEKGDGMIERLLPVSAKEDLATFSGVFYNNTRKNFTDSHLWFSIVLRPQRSQFTRLQRLSCCLCLLFLTMISNAMFYMSEENIVNPAVVHMGVFRFSLQQLYVSAISLAIVMPVNILIVWLFKKSRQRIPQTYVSSNSTCSCCAFSQLIQTSEEMKKLEKALVARGFHSQRQKQLPRGCVYVAWAIVFLSVFLSAFFLFLYSQQWGKSKAEEWLTSFIVSFFESLFVVDPIKVLVVAAVLALFIRKPEESASEGFDKQEIKANQQLTVADKVSDGVRETIQPLTGENLRTAQDMKHRETKAYGVLYEIILYIIFLFIVYTIGYSNRDPRSFTMFDNMVNTMISPKNSVGLSEVQTTETFYKWVNETVFHNLFQPDYDNGARRRWWDRYYLKDLQNYRVGPPRMRQLRSPQMTTCYKKIMGEMPCNMRYYMYQQETRDFCIHWKDPPCADDERAFKFSSDAWTFTSFADSLSLPIFGYYNTYSGGGYIAELDVNFDVSRKILDELFAELWVDRQTRAVIIEYTTFNANVNMFCYVNLMAEFPESGGVLTYYLVRPFRLYQHTGALGIYVLVNELIFIAAVIFGTIKVMMRIKVQRLQYFKDSWNINEFLCLLTCLVCIAIYIVREVVSRVIMSKFHDDPKRFVNFYHLTIWDEVLVSVIGVLSFICTVRMIRVLGYSKRSAALMKVLTNAKPDLYHFSIMFFLMFAAYAMVAFIIFGSVLSDYRDMLVTSATLITTMIGRSPFDDMRFMEPFFAQLYFGSFIFFEVFILLTMFMAILDESIAKVRSDEDVTYDQHDMMDVLISKFKDVIGILLPNRIKKVLSDLATETVKPEAPEQSTASTDEVEKEEKEEKVDLIKAAQEVLRLKKALESKKTSSPGKQTENEGN